MDSLKALPDRCCAKCGFLYALSRNPASTSDAIVDPDLIRAEDIESNYLPGVHGTYSRGVISSRPYSIFMNFGGSGESSISPILQKMTWAEVHSVSCYWNRFSEKVSPRHRQVIYDDEDQKYVPLGSNWIISEIRKDRAECDQFYQYLPGLQPVQHAELQLEENRQTRLQEHEKLLTKWSSEQEKRIALLTLDAEAKWHREEERWKQIEKDLTIRFGIIGAVLALLEIAAIVAQILFK
jgi:hypothetical protein